MQTAVSRSTGSRITRGAMLCFMVAALLMGTRSATLAQAGDVWGWGNNSYGQLGDGTYTARYSPVQPSGITGMAQVATGWYHSLALKSDGTVWAWGYDYYGQLGDGNGTDTTRNTPGQVTGLADAGGNYFYMTQVAAGQVHSLALRADGTVWAWGNNVYGQLGDGTYTTRDTPAQVSGMRNIVQIAVQGYYSSGINSLAVKSDGTVWGWGYNYGSVPTRLPGLSNIVQVAGGGRRYLLLLGRMEPFGHGERTTTGN